MMNFSDYSWILVSLVYIYITCTVTSFTDANQSGCKFKVDSCEYSLHIKPRNSDQPQCQTLQFSDVPESPRFQRVKRYGQDDEDDNNSDSNKSHKDIYKGATKFERRVLKSIDQLSIRVLRGVRRVERKVADLMEAIKANDDKPKQKCPVGFTTIDNWPSCYMFSRFDMSWYQAKDYCAAFDSDLVSLGTTREHFIVTYLIKNNEEYNAVDGWWTSGTFVAKTKQWMWTAQLFLKPFSFIKWAPDEPNEKEAQCMVIAGNDDHLWNDELCTQRFNFVCEADARAI